MNTYTVIGAHPEYAYADLYFRIFVIHIRADSPNAAAVVARRRMGIGRIWNNVRALRRKHREEEIEATQVLAVFPGKLTDEYYAPTAYSLESRVLPTGSIREELPIES